MTAAQTGLIITKAQVIGLMRDLLSKDIRLDTIPTIEPHPATFRGLVTDDNQLVALIASDIAFAHKTGAALAMIPPTAVADKGNEPDPDFIELYHEVANVLSRLVNEAHPTRVRIDPGLEIPVEQLEMIRAEGRVVVQSSVDVEGYGAGNLGIWYKPI